MVSNALPTTTSSTGVRDTNSNLNIGGGSNLLRHTKTLINVAGYLVRRTLRDGDNLLICAQVLSSIGRLTTVDSGHQDKTKEVEA